MSLQHTFTDPFYRQNDRDGMNLELGTWNLELTHLKYQLTK